MYVRPAVRYILYIHVHVVIIIMKVEAKVHMYNVYTCTCSSKIITSIFTLANLGHAVHVHVYRGVYTCTSCIYRCIYTGVHGKRGR